MSHRLRWALLLSSALLASWVAFAPPAVGGEAGASTSPDVELTLFWGEGCPYCAAERPFLEGVPERAKPGMYQRIYHLAGGGRSLPVVLGATAALAAVMRIAPTLLEPAGGTLVVFGVAAVLAGAGLLVDRIARGERRGLAR